VGVCNLLRCGDDSELALLLYRADRIFERGDNLPDWSCWAFGKISAINRLYALVRVLL